MSDQEMCSSDQKLRTLRAMTEMAVRENNAFTQITPATLLALVECAEALKEFCAISDFCYLNQNDLTVSKRVAESWSAARRSIAKLANRSARQVAATLSAASAPPPAKPAEPDWKHPKLQALISSEARLNIERSMIAQLIDDPNADLYGLSDYETDLTEKLRARSAGAAAKPDNPIEAWKADRKVSIYADTVLRVWGPNFDQMLEVPRTHEAVAAALDWLYESAKPDEGRADSDFAIEHGLYLADAVDAYIAAHSDRNVSEALGESTQAENDAVADCWVALRDRAYEFRKRAERAQATPRLACRITEYDGAYRCTVHHRRWGAISKPDEPCAGWGDPERMEWFAVVLCMGDPKNHRTYRYEYTLDQTTESAARKEAMECDPTARVARVTVLGEET